MNGPFIFSIQLCCYLGAKTILKFNPSILQSGQCTIFKFRPVKCAFQSSSSCPLYFTEHPVWVEELVEDGDRGVSRIHPHHVELMWHHRQRDGHRVSQIRSCRYQFCSTSLMFFFNYTKCIVFTSTRISKILQTYLCRNCLLYIDKPHFADILFSSVHFCCTYLHNLEKHSQFFLLYLAVAMFIFSVQQSNLLAHKTEDSCGHCEICSWYSNFYSHKLCSFQIVVVLREVEVPGPLTDLPAVRIEKHGWWTHLLARLALPGQ